MKNKNLIIFIILIVGFGLSILFWQFSQNNSQLSLPKRKTSETESVQSKPTKSQSATPSANQEADQDANQEEADQEIESMPTVSEEQDLETIEQELEQTQILEEDFSDL